MSELQTVWGKSKTFDIQVTNPDGTEYDLTGLDMRFSAKLSRRDADPPDIETAPVIDADPTTGRAVLEIDRADVIAAFPANPYAPLKLYWEAEVTGGASEPEVVDSGTLQIDPAVRTSA